MKKKIIVILLALVLSLGAVGTLTACVDNDDSTKIEDSSSGTQDSSSGTEEDAEKDGDNPFDYSEFD